MNLIMRAPKSQAATISRRVFLGGINHISFGGSIIDRDFDNDNDRPLTAEHLDWRQTGHRRLVYAD